MTRKTDTIKQRSLYVYLPSIEMTERWKQVARERRTSISNFIVETMNRALSDEGEVERYRDIIKERKTLREQVSELSKDVNRYKILIDRLESELRELRAQPFLDEEFKGRRSFPKDLIALLKAGQVRYEDLHARLGIEPGSDASRALQVQLNILEQYGLTELTDRYVRWKQ